MFNISLEWNLSTTKLLISIVAMHSNLSTFTAQQYGNVFTIVSRHRYKHEFIARNRFDVSLFEKYVRIVCVFYPEIYTFMSRVIQDSRRVI